MLKPNGIIAILTDFGLKDNYVGVMKGVILSINREALIVDITNDIPPHNVTAGSFQLYTSYKYFPKGTTFLCVVDPGVGTRRKGIAVETNNYYFVGPDNGLLYQTVMDDGIVKIVELTNRRYFLDKISTTFHGRDIFAPTAAWLSKGIRIDEFGEEVDRGAIIGLRLDVYRKEDGFLKGKVIYIDRFGNVITSIPNSEYESIPKKTWIIVNDKSFKASKASTYGEGKEGEVLVIFGSHGFIEIAINQKSAADKLGLSFLDPIAIKF